MSITVSNECSTASSFDVNACQVDTCAGACCIVLLVLSVRSDSQICSSVDGILAVTTKSRRHTPIGKAPEQLKGNPCVRTRACRGHRRSRNKQHGLEPEHGKQAEDGYHNILKPGIKHVDVEICSTQYAAY